MKTELIAPVELSEDDINALSRLLLNSWSAEYALRITPVVTDEDYLRSALHWTFPQAYYSASLSLRAVLLTLGCPTSQELSQLASAQVLHKYGLYDGTILPSNFFQELHKLKRIISPELAMSMDATGQQTQLINIIDQVAFAHEAHILEAVGPEIYNRIIKGVPAYLKDSFLSERLFCITKKEVVTA